MMMMMITGIINHMQSQNISVNLETNMLNLSQLCIQCYDKIKESMKIWRTHVMIPCKLLIFGEDDLLNL